MLSAYCADMAAARYSSDVLQRFCLKKAPRIQAERAKDEPLREDQEMLKEPQTCTQTRGLSEAIQSLPPELRERILKELIVVKINEKNGMGWGMVHESLLNLPFCKHFKKIVNKVTSSELTGCIFECTLFLVELEIRKRMFEKFELTRRSKEEKNVLKFLGPSLEQTSAPENFPIGEAHAQCIQCRHGFRSERSLHHTFTGQVGKRIDRKRLGDFRRKPSGKRLARDWVDVGREPRIFGKAEDQKLAAFRHGKSEIRRRATKVSETSKREF